MASPVLSKLLLAIFGIATGLVCFWLAARGVDINEAKTIFKSSDWRWILIGITLFGVDLILRITRWYVIVSYRCSVEYFRLAQGLIVGYAVNILLPARLGELFRADYTARLTDIGRPILLGSIFVERLLDLIAVVIIFGIGLAFIDAQNSAIGHVMILGVVACVAGILLTAVSVLGKARTWLKILIGRLISKSVPRRLQYRILATMRDFANMVEIVRMQRFILVVALTVPIWIAESASMWSICRAVGLMPTVLELMTLLGGASLSTLFPTAPGFVGSYQFAFVLVLRNFHVPDTLALVAASGVQLYLMGFYAALGLFVWAVMPVRRWSTTKSAARRPMGC